MKLKVKDQMDKIKLNVSYDELFLIQEALKTLSIKGLGVTEYNIQVFDRQEVKSKSQIDNKISDLVNTIEDGTDDIYPF